MQDPRISAAMDRIERALDRLQAALPDEPPAPVGLEELDRLRSAHTLLRSRVEAAIGEIDRMLAPAEGASG